VLRGPVRTALGCCLSRGAERAGQCWWCGLGGPRVRGGAGPWVSFATGVLQAACEGNRPGAPQGSLVDKSLSLRFPTKLSRVTFRFLSVSSEGMIVLYRRDLVYVYFKLNEEETGTGCFLLNPPAVKF